MPNSPRTAWTIVLTGVVLGGMSSCFAPPLICRPREPDLALVQHVSERYRARIRTELEGYFEGCQKAKLQACLDYAQLAKRAVIPPLHGFTADASLARACSLGLPTACVAATPSSPAKPDGAFTRPTLKARREFVHPPEASRARIGGEVVLGVSIDTLGRVTHAFVLKSEPVGFFEEAAAAYVKTFRYEPATLDSVPVHTWMTVRLRIRFDSLPDRDPRCVTPTDSPMTIETLFGD